MMMPTLPAWYRPAICCGKARLTARPSNFVPKLAPFDVLRVVLEGDRRGGFDVVEPVADVGHVFVEGVERRFDRGPACWLRTLPSCSFAQSS